MACRTAVPSPTVFGPVTGYWAARFMNNAGEFGVIREGARADLLLLAGDPEADLGVLRTPQGVMAAGRWYNRARLDTLLGEVERSAQASRTPSAQ